MEHGLHDLAVSAGQHLTEYRGRNLYEHYLSFGPIQPRGLKPGIKCVDADAGLHPLQESVPKVCCFALFAKLDSRRHLNEKPNPRYFHRCAYPVERPYLCLVTALLKYFLVREGRPSANTTMPLSSAHVLFQFLDRRTASAIQRGILSD